ALPPLTVPVATFVVEPDWVTDVAVAPPAVTLVAVGGGGSGCCAASGVDSASRRADPSPAHKRSSLGERIANPSLPTPLTFPIRSGSPDSSGSDFVSQASANYPRTA